MIICSCEYCLRNVIKPLVQYTSISTKNHLRNLIKVIIIKAFSNTPAI